MPTLSIYFIGTGHDRTEVYNLLVLLHALTKAENKVTTNGTRITMAMNDVLLNEDAKVIFDGVPSLSTTDNARDLLNEMSEACVGLCQRMNESTGTLVVNVVGHSRGAINAMVFANNLAKSIPTARAKVNLFLIDPVRHASIPEEESLLVADNVIDCRQVVMEDEGTIPSFALRTLGGFTSGALFKLAFIRRKLPLPEGAHPITTIRLPGTHGTASQCNPITPGGADVPNLKLSDLLKGEAMWPIGAVALLTILHQLHTWGTNLILSNSSVEKLKPRIVREYAMIVHVNRLFRSGSRRLNDLGKSSPGQKQDIKFVKGGRSEALFFGLNIDINPFRRHRFFVNEHHAGLFRELFSDPERGGLLMRQLTQVAQPEGSMDLFEGLSRDNRTSLIQELKAFPVNDRLGYDLIRKLRLKIDGVSLPLVSADLKE